MPGPPEPAQPPAARPDTILPSALVCVSGAWAAWRGGFVGKAGGGDLAARNTGRPVKWEFQTNNE